MSKSIFIRLMISVIVVLILSSSFYLPEAYALGDVFQAGSDFLTKGNSIDQTIDMGALETTSDYIYNTLLAIAIMVAVVVSMVLGIQFMVASADEKAKVKEALMPFVVGCIVVFGAFTIWNVAVNIGNKAENNVKSSALSADPDGDGFVTPPIKGYKCNACGEEIDIPAGITMGDRDYTCPTIECDYQVVEKGKINGATKQ